MRIFGAKPSEYFDTAFRILIGLLFMEHGAQKLFGWFGGTKVAIASLMGVAGIIETFGGLLIVLGLFTRIIAAFGAIEMLYAFVFVHAKQGWIPIVNKGELALVYFAAFLILIAHGSGKRWSLDRHLLGLKSSDGSF